MSKKISELTAAGALTGTELVEVVQSSASRRTTAQDIADLAGSGISGLTTGRLPKAASSTSIDDSVVHQNSTSIGIGTTSPDRKFHVEEDSATTNAVTYVERLTSTSSGTPANGIGVGLEFETETSAGNNEVGATIEVVATDVTAASEDFDIVFKTMAAGAAAAERLRITSDGRLYGTALHNNAGSVTGTTNQYVASGTWSPTITAITNISASSSQTSQWMRVGNVVTLSGTVAITPTASGTTTEIRMSLPIASNFTVSSNCAGGANNAIGTSPAVIRPDTANDEAILSFQSIGTINANMYFYFTYVIL